MQPQNCAPEEDHPISGPYATQNGQYAGKSVVGQGYDFGVVRPNPYQEDFRAQARKGFVKKVYAIVCTQLIFTIALVWIFNATETDKKLVDEKLVLTRAGKWVLYTSIALIFTISIALGCFFQYARKVPTNYILLFIYTLAFSFVCVCACARYNPNYVISAALNTFGITAVLTAYARITKTEITYGGAVKFMLIWLVISIPIMIVVGVNGNRFSGLYAFLQLLVIILYGFFIVWDTKLIVGQKRSGHQLDLDEYILGALFLYTDIINLFLRILGAGGKKD